MPVNRDTQKSLEGSVTTSPWKGYNSTNQKNLVSEETQNLPRKSFSHCQIKTKTKAAKADKSTCPQDTILTHHAHVSAYFPSADLK